MLQHRRKRNKGTVDPTPLSKQLQNTDRTLEQMLEAKKKMSSWAAFAGAALFFAGLGLGFLGGSYKSADPIKVEMDRPKAKTDYQEMGRGNAGKAPEFRFPANFSNGWYLIFFDDNAVGMRSYAKQGNSIHELPKGRFDVESASFKVPKEYLTGKQQLEVYAIDRNANESKHKTIYTFEGFVSEKPIPE